MGVNSAVAFWRWGSPMKSFEVWNIPEALKTFPKVCVENPTIRENYPPQNSQFAPENGPKPKRKRPRLPTIHFQVRTVSFRWIPVTGFSQGESQVPGGNCSAVPPATTTWEKIVCFWGGTIEKSPGEIQETQDSAGGRYVFWFIWMFMFLLLGGTVFLCFVFQNFPQFSKHL